MKFLIVGLGSMGKRRIRNLQYLKAGKIIGFDTREDRAKDAEEKYNIQAFTDFEEAMGQNPDAVIISTPPDLHVKYALQPQKTTSISSQRQVLLMKEWMNSSPHVKASK